MMGLLPNATDKLSLNVPVEQLQQELKKALVEQSQWVETIFEQAVLVASTDHYEEEEIKVHPLAGPVSLQLLEKLLHILSMDQPLSQDKLDFINDVRLALGVSGKDVDKLIEQIDYLPQTFHKAIAHRFSKSSSLQQPTLYSISNPAHYCLEYVPVRYKQIHAHL